jgi:hypothetical protein
VGGPLAFEIWEGVAELPGYGAIIGDAYPIEDNGQYGSAGESVELKISEPTMAPGPLGSNIYKQTI